MTCPRCERLERALKDVMNNLGVPQPGYPAPVAYAYEIANKALEARECGHRNSTYRETVISRCISCGDEQEVNTKISKTT